MCLLRVATHEKPWLQAAFETLFANVTVPQFRRKVVPHSWCRRTETADRNAHSMWTWDDHVTVIGGSQSNVSYSGSNVNRSTFDKAMGEKRFYILVSSDLDLWPLDFKFAPLVTLAQRYVSTELEVSTAFLFRENRKARDGRTDRQTDSQTDGRKGCDN